MILKKYLLYIKIELDQMAIRCPESYNNKYSFFSRSYFRTPSNNCLILIN